MRNADAALGRALTRFSDLDRPEQDEVLELLATHRALGKVVAYNLARATALSEAMAKAASPDMSIAEAAAAAGISAEDLAWLGEKVSLDPDPDIRRFEVIDRMLVRRGVMPPWLQLVETGD